MPKFDNKTLNEISELSKIMEKNNLSELEISDGKFTFKLKKQFAEYNSTTNTPKIIKETPNKDKHTNTDKALKSPLVGTAYLSPEPGAKSFIEIGQNVKIGQVLLIIEAMKTMNEFKADKDGIIKKIFIKNETPVEFGERLILIE